MNYDFFRIFASMNEMNWKENIIIVDADYVDGVAFNLICNFERMLGRRIPQADMARWLDCVALDGGLREGEHQTQVVFIHQKERQQMANFAPGNYADDLTGKAFKDNLGEFLLSAYPIEAEVGGADFFADAVQMACMQKEVKRLMLIPNAEDSYIINKVRETLRRNDEPERQVTLFAMQPLAGGSFRQEILGYSLMAALGIRSDEFKGMS